MSETDATSGGESANVRSATLEDLAVLLAETGRQDQAFTLLKNWASTDPKSADARIELARLYQA